jgi:nucleoside-diphosphate-sugar epimerase
MRERDLMDGRVVLLGATGFLGRALAPALLAAGRQLVMVARRPAAAAVGATFVACDAAHPGALACVLRPGDLLVNATAGSNATILAVVAMARAALADGLARRLVQISSLAVFGQRYGMLDEATVPRPPPWHGYAVAKLRAEAMLRANLSIEASCVILRPGCMYGPGAPIWSDRIGRLLIAGRLGSLGPQARGWCHAVHVNDVAQAVVRALDAPDVFAGIHHVLAPDQLTWNGYFARFAEHLGCGEPKRIAPAQLAAETWAVAPLARLRGRFGQPPADIITPAMRRLFRCRALAVQRRAPLLLASEYRPLEAGLAEAATSLRQRCSAAASTSGVLLPAWATAT